MRILLLHLGQRVVNMSLCYGYYTCNNEGQKTDYTVFCIHRAGGRKYVNAAALIERGVCLDVIKITLDLKAVFFFLQKGQSAMENVASSAMIFIRVLK